MVPMPLESAVYSQLKMLVLSKLPLLLGATATLLGTGECRQSKHSGSHTRIGGGDGVSATGAAGSSATGSPSSGGGSSGSCEAISDVAITFYGYPDNDPPSDETAYSCSSRGAHAGGTGSYDDPLSFATAPGEYNKCEIIYLPYLQKYLRFDDTCAQCTTDYSSGKKHIDVWTGSSEDGGQAQIQCEDDLTPDSEIVLRNPATTLAVNTGALWDGSKCHTEKVSPSPTITSC